MATDGRLLLIEIERAHDPHGPGLWTVVAEWAAAEVMLKAPH